MNGKKILMYGWSVFLGVCLISPVAQADIYMKQKQHQDGMTVMGQTQPAEDVVSEVWITKKGMRSDNSKNSVIMLPDEGRMIMIDHQQKRYSEMPLNMGGVMGQGMEGADAEEKAAFQGMMGKMMKMDVSVQPTKETKKIKKWNCRKYLMTMKMFGGMVNNEIWATEDIKMDQTLYSKYRSGNMLAIPGVSQAMAAMEKEAQKIKGVQVLSVSSNQVMGQTVKSSTELLEYKQAKAPRNLFKLPYGYTKEDVNIDAGGQQPPSQRGMPKMPKGLFGMGAAEEDMPPQPEEQVDLKSLLKVFK